LTNRIRGNGIGMTQETPSTGELVTRLSEQMSTLVRDELALARAEMTEKGKRAGTGAGLLGGGGVLALYGVAGLITTAILGLAEVWAPWLAALVVTVVLFAVAGVLALVGRSEVKRAAPPVPERTKENVQADVETVKNAVREGRHA
jgi:uncharacterized membrane protein YqjE